MQLWLCTTKCPFWRNVQSHCKRLGFDFSVEDFKTHYRSGGWWNDRIIRAGIKVSWMEHLRDLLLNAGSGARTTISTLGRNNAVLVEAICQVQAKNVFLDASKDPVRLKYLAETKRFDISVIHLVRDGRAVVASYKKKYNPDVRRCIKSWKSATLECERAKRD